MDIKTIEKLAEFICGDTDEFPIYRKGLELTNFFKSIDIDEEHDGTSRKKWVINVLHFLDENEIKNVIKRLADPKEYSGNKEKILKAYNKLNEILYAESIEVLLIGNNPKIKKIKPIYNISSNQNENNIKEFILPPNFNAIGVESFISNILNNRWLEVQKCLKSEAYLASLILMGSILEGLLVSIINANPEKANRCNLSPKEKNSEKIKKFDEWSLIDMINVAHEIGWIDLEIKKFSHILREFRNIIHPYQQHLIQFYPDKDTCIISWDVVVAACNDIVKNFKQKL